MCASDRDAELEEEGFVVVRELLTFDECDAVIAALPESPRRRGGVRNLIDEPAVRRLPPAAILASMLAIRIHLDDCGESNGPLRVIPRTHRHGKLSATEIAALVASRNVITLPMKKGAAIIMRPLLVHTSSPAKSPGIDACSILNSTEATIRREAVRRRCANQRSGPFPLN